MNRRVEYFTASQSRSILAHGFTLVELLVVIAIMGVLISMMLPAVQSAREAARRNECRGHLAQLFLALQNYETAHLMFPSGVLDGAGPIRNEPMGRHHGWLIQVLPYLEQGNVYAHVDRGASVYDGTNEPVRKLRLETVVCPTDDPAADWPASNYAALHHDVEAPIDADNHGVFFLNSQVKLDDIRDGSAQTIFLGEKLATAADLGWMSGTRATLRNTGSAINAELALPPPSPEAIEDFKRLEKEAEERNEALRIDGVYVPDCAAEGQGPDPAALVVGGFGSRHPDGANFAFGDGQVRFLSQSIDRQVYSQLGHRADGKLLPSLDSY